MQNPELNKENSWFDGDERFKPKSKDHVSHVDETSTGDRLPTSHESLSGHQLESVTTLSQHQRSTESSSRQSQPSTSRDEVASEKPYRSGDSAYRRPVNAPPEVRPVDPPDQPERKERVAHERIRYQEGASAESVETIYQRAEQPVSTYSDSFFQQETPYQRTVDSPFVSGTVAAASVVSSLAGVYQREDAGPKIQSVRRSLDDALEAWWTESAVPSKALLRNGLLVLEAGHSLDEAHRTLLLRTALRYQRGMVTALSHQTDPDRTAYLLKEALLFEKSPLSPQILWHLLREDADSEEWKLLLEDDLLFNLDSFSPTRQRLATAAIHQLDNDALLSSTELDSAATIVTRTSHSMSWNAGRFLLLLLLIPVIIGVNSLRSERADLTGMATIPAGNYATGQLTNGTPVYVEAFAIEQTEVTNHSYRLCMQQRACLPPAEISSVTRPQYFLNPLYDRYPVVNVDWWMARQYCEWAGKRLPTEAEWEIAASAAPATDRRFDYPWGNTFLQQYANSNLADIQDTKEVGTYHPAGTSPTGATDMAGNVAEWTTSRESIAIHRIRADQTFAVKGGSYIDAPELLRSSSSPVLIASETRPWLGFRCAITLPQEETN